MSRDIAKKLLNRELDKAGINKFVDDTISSLTCPSNIVAEIKTLLVANFSKQDLCEELSDFITEIHRITLATDDNPILKLLGIEYFPKLFDFLIDYLRFIKQDDKIIFIYFSFLTYIHDNRDYEYNIKDMKDEYRKNCKNSVVDSYFYYLARSRISEKYSNRIDYLLLVPEIVDFIYSKFNIKSIDYYVGLLRLGYVTNMSELPNFDVSRFQSYTALLLLNEDKSLRYFPQTLRNKSMYIGRKLEAKEVYKYYKGKTGRFLNAEHYIKTVPSKIEYLKSNYHKLSIDELIDKLNDITERFSFMKMRNYTHINVSGYDDPKYDLDHYLSERELLTGIFDLGSLSINSKYLTKFTKTKGYKQIEFFIEENYTDSFNKQPAKDMTLAMENMFNRVLSQRNTITYEQYIYRLKMIVNGDVDKIYARYKPARNTLGESNSKSYLITAIIARFELFDTVGLDNFGDFIDRLLGKKISKGKISRIYELERLKNRLGIETKDSQEFKTILNTLEPILTDETTYKINILEYITSLMKSDSDYVFNKCPSSSIISSDQFKLLLREVGEEYENGVYKLVEILSCKAYTLTEITEELTFFRSNFRKFFDIKPDDEDKRKIIVDLLKPYAKK